MSYIVKSIDEDIEFGCEERADDQPVMAIVTLVDKSNINIVIKMEDELLYQRNINESSRVCFDKDNKLILSI